MEEQRQTLCRLLDTVDTSMGFLGLLIVSLGLSGKRVPLQREGLCGGGGGEPGEAPDTFFLRLPASAIVVGALTCFFRLALDAWEQAGGQDCCARRSAQVNLWASLLVLAAALLRLYDLVCLQRSGDAEEQEE